MFFQLLVTLSLVFTYGGKITSSESVFCNKTYCVEVKAKKVDVSKVGMLMVFSGKTKLSIYKNKKLKEKYLADYITYDPEIEYLTVKGVVNQSFQDMTINLKQQKLRKYTLQTKGI